MACPYATTIDGFESQFAVNHLAHFLLATSLVPQLEAGRPSRVVVVSSVANKFGGINWTDINWQTNYDKWGAYAQSKASNILFAKQFDKLYASHGIHAFAIHPGGIMTNLQQHIPDEEKRAMGWHNEEGGVLDLFKNVEQGASTTIYAALAPQLDQCGGEYIEDCAVSKGINIEPTYWGLAPHAADMDNAERLWKISEQMVMNK
jgi:NAD(P)-dependent dehydrogenase (short-subunit alcohol dehydrogenase family)